MARAYHEHPIFRFSSVARPVDARYPTNKAVLAMMFVALIAGGAWGLVDGVAISGAVLRGVSLAVTVFGSWALGRELDPDRNATAFVGAALAVAAVVVVGDADLWTLMAAIPLTRVVNRTVGPPAKISDLVAVLGLVALAMFTDGRWSLGVTAVVALLLDASLRDGRADRWAFAAVAAAMVGAFHFQTGLSVTVPEQLSVVGGVLAVGVVALVTMPSAKSECDLPDNTLVPTRVTAGVGVALVLFVVAQLETGQLAAAGVAAAIVAMLPGRLLRLKS